MFLANLLSYLWKITFSDSEMPFSRISTWERYLTKIWNLYRTQKCMTRNGSMLTQDQGYILNYKGVALWRSEVCCLFSYANKDSALKEDH